ncbi:putative ABC transport system permease protein [Williamsia limnetica]|uniref:Putative ABC transport system permease protein n=1 Tax=Williamsia limnetica TaxID=882452 RepID=A0A318RA60_WILLI|nr:ABC transporter permease [Williamsia limnetica]PYE12575.1 putative ABC transport system permease protein [Williamsia limnetica]
MKTVVLAQLRAYKGRYVASGLAVAIAVAFVAATLTLSATSSESMRASVAGQFSHTDAAAFVPGEFAERTGAALAATPGVDATAVDSTRWVSVTSGTRSFGQVQLTAIAPDESLRWQTLSVGHLPKADNEVVAFAGSNFAVGEHFYVRPDVDTGTDRVAREMTVVGLLDRASTTTSAPQLFGTNAGVAALAPGRAVDQAESVVIRMSFTPGADQAVVMSAITRLVTAVPGGKAMTGGEATDEVMSRYVGETDVLATVLLVFAAITALVSCLVIANTFAVLIASRTQELALLRCIGADTGQVRSGVRLEALVLGVLASVVGVVFGISGVAAASALVRSTGANFPLTELTVPLTAPVAAMVLGVVMTVIAATVPARLATAVSPLAAFRTVVPSSPGRRGILRLLVAAALVGGGSIIMTVGVGAKSVPAAGLGGASSFLGIMLAAVVLVPPLVRIIGVGAARLLRRTAAGPVAELAAANATRHPRRTAATASALIIGITLTTMMVVGAQVVRSSVSGLIGEMHPIDLVVSSSAPLDPSLINVVASTAGVEASLPVTRTEVSVNGHQMNVGALDTGRLSQVMRSGHAPAADEIALAPEDQILAGVGPGERVRLAAGGGVRTVTVIDGASGSFVDRGLVSAAPQATGIVVRLQAGGADSSGAVTDIREIVANSAPDATFGGGVEIAQQLDQILILLLRIVLALLAVSVIVALIGVGNTMALSVIDRSRENAMLRVIGLSSRGVQGMLLAEAALIAVVGSVVGVLLGTGYGIAGAAAVVGAHRVSLPDLPVVALAGIVLVGGLAGLLSSAIPARRALKADPAAAL